ncbi:unnamed protein product [Closterium sp. NIES-54]
MHSRLLVSGLPNSLPSLPHSPASPCLPCIEGRQRAAPHSLEFPPTTAPLQTLHMDVWGPAPVGGTDQERYFLLVVDDNIRYTTVFPLHSKADDSGVLIPWIRATRRQLRERSSRDFPVLRLHTERGSEFSSDLLAEFCRDEGIVQIFTLPASPQQTEIAERRIGLIMEVARTSMIHVAAPHFLWPFAGPAPSGVSQVDPPPLVEPLEISSDSSGPAEGGDPAADDTVATRLSPRLETPPGFPPRPSSPPPQPACGATTRGAATGGAGSGGAATGGAGSLGAAIRGVDYGGTAGAGGTGGTAGGAGGAGGTSGAADVGGAKATSPRGATGAGGAGPTSPGGRAGARGAGDATGAGGAGAGGTGGAGAAGPGGVCTGGAGAAGAGGVVRAGGATGAAGSGGARGTAGAGGARDGGAVGTRGAGGTAGAGGARARGTRGTGGAGAAGPGGARTRGAGAAGAGGGAGAGGVVRAGVSTGAAGTGGAGGTAAAGAGGVAGAGGAGGATRAAGTGGSRGTAGAGGAGTGGTWVTRGAGAAGAGGAGAVGAGGAGAAGSAPRPLFFYPQPQSSLPPPDSVLRQVLSLPSSTGLTPPLLCPPTDQSPPQLLPGSSQPAPAPHTEVTESPTERRETETRASTPVRACCVDRPHPPIVPGTHGMALCPSSIPRRVVLPEPPASSLPHVPDPLSDLAHAASPSIIRLLATVITDPDLESTSAFALVTELVDFAARSRLDYVASLVTESESLCPPSVGCELALGSDVLEDRQFELECLVAALPRFASMLLCLEGDSDALDIPTPRSYAGAITGEYSSQWQIAMDAEMASWKSTGTYVNEVPPPGANIVDGMWIFRVKQPPGSPPAFKARYVARGFRQRACNHSLGSIGDHQWTSDTKMTTLQVLLHVAAQSDYELHSLDFSTAFLQGSLHEEIWLRRPPGFTGSFPAGTQTTLAALGFAPSSADPSLFLRTDTTLSPFYVLVYVDDLVFATVDTEALALPPSSRAAQQPSRPAAEPPSRPVAEPPSSRATEPPSRPATEPPSRPAVEPLLFLLARPGPTYSDWADGLSLFDLTSGASPAPPATADSTVRSQWATRDAAARLAVCRHLPTTERAHFSQYKSAQTLYDAVVARYSSPATAVLSRLMLPYLFPDLAAFPTVADLITHLLTSDTRYRAALPAEFCAKNPPPHGCSPSPLLPSVASAAAADLGGFESVGAASNPSGRRRTGKGKGGKGAGGAGGGGGGGGGGSGGGGGGGGSGGGGGGVGGSSGGGGGGGGGGGSGGGGGGGGGRGGGGGGGSGGAGRGSAQRSGSGGGQRQQQQRSRATLSLQQLREWYAARQRGGGTGPCTYVLHTGDRAGEQCEGPHSTQRCFGRLTDAWRHQFPDATEIPRWGELSRAGFAIFDLDYDAILAAMYAVCDSVEGDCYLCVLPDPGIEAAALGTGEAAALGAGASAAPGAGESALSGTTSAQAFHTFTLDSGASRSFFRDRTTLTPLSRPVAVSLADPSGGPVLASFTMDSLV